MANKRENAISICLLFKRPINFFCQIKTVKLDFRRGMKKGKGRGGFSKFYKEKREKTKITVSDAE